MWVLFVQVFRSTPVIHRMRSTESKISPLHFSLPSIDKQSLSSRMDGGGGLCGCGDGLGKQFGFCLAIYVEGHRAQFGTYTAGFSLSLATRLHRLLVACCSFQQCPERKLGRGFLSSSQMLITPCMASITWVYLCVCVLFFNLKYHLPSHTFRFVPMKANQLIWNAFVRY